MSFFKTLTRRRPQTRLMKRHSAKSMSFFKIPSCRRPHTHLGTCFCYESTPKSISDPGTLCTPPITLASCRGCLRRFVFCEKTVCLLLPRFCCIPEVPRPQAAIHVSCFLFFVLFSRISLKKQRTRQSHPCEVMQAWEPAGEEPSPYPEHHYHQGVTG